MTEPTRATEPTPLQFFSTLRWIDGRPLLETIDLYRQRIFREAFARDAGGKRRYNMVLTGRGKKNHKTTDTVLSALYELLVPVDPRGNDCCLVANDEDQAADDLDLAKKIVAANDLLRVELVVQAKGIYRADGRGALRILPAGDVAGMHGKTFRGKYFDEVWAYRNYDIFEALADDPTREVMTWIASYDTIYSTAGVPLFDLKRRGMSGDDPRMFFSWYSADFTTDPEFADVSAEQRANPSMGVAFGMDYIEQQRMRLPAHKFRRLHLNLPGMPDGGVLDPGAVEDCIVAGRRELPPVFEQSGGAFPKHAFVDLGLGGDDSTVIAISQTNAAGTHQVAAIQSQAGRKPYDVRETVRTRFVPLCRAYGITRVVGDAVGGPDARLEFERAGIGYVLASERGLRSKHDIYSEFQVLLHARRVELLDHTLLREQLLGLVYRGQRIDHQPNEHDDYANAAAGALVLAARAGVSPGMPAEVFRGDVVRDGFGHGVFEGGAPAPWDF